MKKSQAKKLILKITFRRNTFRVDISYLYENWGAPFIIGFMMLLMVAAFSLVSGLDSLANEVAVYAYYLLVVGVVLQLISFLRGRREGSEQK